MKSHTEYLTFETRKRREMVHITDQVEQIVKRSGVKDGLCFVSPMHITAAVYVNDHESGLIEDIGKWLEELAPARPDYKHHQTGKTTGTPISSRSCCTMKPRCRLRVGAWIWVHGSGFSTQSLMGNARSESSSRY